MSDLICVLGRGGECVAKTPEACLCRQMPELIYRRERDRLYGPPAVEERRRSGLHTDSET